MTHPHPHHHHQHPHSGKEHPTEKGGRHPWWIWVLVVLMLGAMVVYVLTLDESFLPW